MKHLALFAVALAFAGAAAAQPSYPNRPLRIVIPWPPGQATDLVGRLIAQKLTETFGQQVVADNRPGAGGMIGTEMAVRATPDGYTLLAASMGPITTAPLLQKVPYDVDRQLVPVAMVGLSPFVLVTHAAFPAANAREFVALVRANPGKYTFSSSGTGAAAHLIASWFHGMAKLQSVHVPYKGSAPAMIDVMGGQIAYTIETAAATMPHIRAGRLKAHGVTVARPTAVAPGIPPLAIAADVPGYDASAWVGVMVATGTPKAVVDRLAAAVEKAMQAPDVIERMLAISVEVDYRKADAFTRHLNEQRTRIGEVIKANNIRIE